MPQTITILYNPANNGLVVEYPENEQLGEIIKAQLLARARLFIDQFPRRGEKSNEVVTIEAILRGQDTAFRYVE